MVQTQSNDIPQKKKPVVLWTCDVPGWAYHTRIMRMSATMPEYEHQIWYFGNPLSFQDKKKILDRADIIVCQGVKALRIVRFKTLDFLDMADPQQVLDQRFDNIVARLDSMRIDHNGEYYDIWTGDKIQ